MAKTNKTRWITREIHSLKKSGLYINVRTLKSPVNGRVQLNGKRVVNLSSNNYLGLANNKRLKNAAKKAIDKFGISPAAVRTIAGSTQLHVLLEKKLATFKKVDDVITLQSGYAANLAVIPALVGEGGLIFSDELNHASIIDACRLSKAEVVRYKHLDTNDLGIKLATSKHRKVKKIIVSDGVFSMDGDIAPLDKIHTLAEKYDALTMVDDAHGEGVLGTNGRGIVDHFHLHGKIDVEIGTMSKAFGVVGGFVAGKKLIIDWLRQRARPFLFSSAMTIPDTAACIEAVNLLHKSDKLVKKLWKNSQFFKSTMQGSGFDIGKSQTPITPIMLYDERLTQEFSKKLYEKGVFATAIAYPTVPLGKARIRAIVSAAHTIADLKTAVSIFQAVGKSLKVI